MIHLSLMPGVVMPGLWIRGPEDLDRARLVHQLDAIGAEAILDCGGWDALLRDARWIEPGDPAPSMEMDIARVILDMVDRATREGPTNAAAAKRLGINLSTLYRWQRRLARPGITSFVRGTSVANPLPEGHSQP